MKKVLIIEDERISAIRLEKLIHEIDDTIEVEGPLVSVSEVVEHLRRHNDYDLIFADIRLSDSDVFTAPFKKSCPPPLLSLLQLMMNMPCKPSRIMV